LHHDVFLLTQSVIALLDATVDIVSMLSDPYDSETNV